MSTTSMNYASFSALTITLASLGNGSWRQSAVVDNTVTKYLDAMLGGVLTTGTSPTNLKTLDVYLYALAYTGVYTSGASGSDAAYTADGEEYLFKPVESIRVDTTSNAGYVFGPVSVAAAFGGTMPSKWGVVIENNTGVSLNATGSNHVLEFQGIKADTA